MKRDIYIIFRWNVIEISFIGYFEFFKLHFNIWVLNYTDIKNIEKIKLKHLFSLTSKRVDVGKPFLFVEDITDLFLWNYVNVVHFFFKNIQYHIKIIKKQHRYRWSILVIELLLTFIDRELESQFKSRRDMQRRQPGTHSMQKQGTSSVPFYGLK